MQFNLKLSRKTWYALLVFAAAAQLLNACAVLTGHNWGFLDTLGFSGTGMAILFLAAEKGSPKAEKQGYFFAFLALLLGYLFGAPLGYLFGALAWPLLLLTEQKRGSAVQNRLRLVAFAEVMHTALLLAAGAMAAAGFWANLLWLLTCAARGSGALALYLAKTEG